MDWYVLTPAGKLHRAEMKDATGQTFSSSQVSDLSRYDLCGRCFPPKQGAPESATPASDDKPVKGRKDETLPA